MLDLTKFEFPAPKGLLPVGGTIPELLKEARDRGFYKGDTPYNRLFRRLFFHGGAPKFKQDVDADFRKRALEYLAVFMRSFAPKHEEKEAVCAMLLSEICEP